MWVYRSESAPTFLTLRAARAGSDEVIVFELFRPGTSTPTVAWPGGGIAHPYGHTSREAVFRTPGCWVIHLLDGGPEEIVVLPVR